MILEFVSIRGIIGVEHSIIVRNGCIQEIPGVLIQGRGILRIFFIQDSVRFFLIGPVAVNNRYFELAPGVLLHLALELRIVQLGGIYRGNGKNGIESAKPLLLLDFFDLLPGIGRSDLGNVL